MDKVLIKHDDEDMRHAIGNALATWGYLTQETGDVHCLYELAIPENPSIILLDLMKPITGTLAALNMLSANQNTASIPVIILSNSNDPQYQRLCMQEGAFDYLGSGWTLADLRDRIQTALTNRSSSELT